VRLAWLDHHPEGVILQPMKLRQPTSSGSYDDAVNVWSDDLDAMIALAP
jgi:hypothetical protein